MKASNVRNIKNGNEYNSYFKPAKMGVIELAEGDVFDTLDRIQSLVTNTLYQTKEISSILTTSNLKKTLNNVWSFLYNHIQYKEDAPGIEQLRTPLRSWADRKSGIDCDCYSIFISSILTNLNIPHSLRIAEYGSKGYYQHVYIVVPIDGANIKGRNSYIVIDPVVNNFNYEVDFTKKHDKKMSIAHQVLNGIPFSGDYTSSFGSEFDVLDGLGSVSEHTILNSMRNHLSNTLVELNKNMEAVAAFVNADVFKEQVEYVLENWNDPIARMAALEEMEEMEDLNEDAPDNNVNSFVIADNKALTKVKLLRNRRQQQRRVVPAVLKRNTLPVSILKYSKKGTALNGLRKFFSKVKNVVSNTVNKVKNTVSTVANKVGQGIKTAAKAVIKYNPLTLAMRGGMLLALRLNLLKITERLKYGYLSQQQAIAKRIDLNEWRKIVIVKNQAEQFYRSIGGDTNRFKQAVLNGKNGGLGEPISIASATGAVSALLAKIGGLLKNIKFDKLQKAASKVRSFVSTHKSLVNSVKSLIPPRSNERSTPDFSTPPITTPGYTPPPIDIPPTGAEKPTEKNNTLLYVGGGVGLLVAGYLYTQSQNNNKPKPVNGTPKKKVKHAKI